MTLGAREAAGALTFGDWLRGAGSACAGSACADGNGEAGGEGAASVRTSGVGMSIRGLSAWMSLYTWRGPDHETIPQTG